jgi:hypothetical protein
MSILPSADTATSERHAGLTKLTNARGYSPRVRSLSARSTSRLWSRSAIESRLS